MNDLANQKMLAAMRPWVSGTNCFTVSVLMYILVPSFNILPLYIKLLSMYSPLDTDQI